MQTIVEDRRDHRIANVANPETEADAVRALLTRILASPEFVASQRLSNFLRFVVAETLAGRANRIKQTTIAIDVFGRDVTFDAQSDSVVRMEAAKLRQALKLYYLSEGSEESLRIEIPKGSYVPVFSWLNVTKQQEEVVSGYVDTPASRIRDRPRIAVLPFVNRSHNPVQGYFAEDISEGLSTALTRVDSVSVVSHYSMLRVKDEIPDLREIGQELDVDYLVSGSVRMSGEKVRVYVQLSHAMNDTQVWAERFDRILRAENIFEAQDGIVERIVASIGDNYGFITRTQTQALQEGQINDITAYGAILKSLRYFRLMTPGAYEDALHLLEQAVDTNPEHARAWATLGVLYGYAYALDMGEVDNSLERLAHCAQKAISLDSCCQEAHLAMAIAALLKHDRKGVISSVDEIIKINSKAAFLIGTAGWVMSLAGELERGMRIISDSIMLNPQHPAWFHLAPYLYYYQQGDFEAALVEANKFGLPDFFLSSFLHAAVLAQLGRTGEAAVAVKQLQCLRPDFVKGARSHIKRFVLSDELVDKLLEGLELATADDHRA